MADIKIHNFAQVDKFLYRGSQPSRSEYADLAALKVHTIIDLQDNPKPWACATAKEAGMRYINLPMSDSDYPDPHLAGTWLAFACDVNEHNRPFYVHCHGGRHRTGALCAIYRMRIDHWGLGAAMKELESFDFGLWKWRWTGHKQLRRYVEDYAAAMGREARL